MSIDGRLHDHSVKRKETMNLFFPGRMNESLHVTSGQCQHYRLSMIVSPAHELIRIILTDIRKGSCCDRESSDEVTHHCIFLGKELES